jgi:hypothetical protein
MKLPSPALKPIGGERPRDSSGGRRVDSRGGQDQVSLLKKPGTAGAVSRRDCIGASSGTSIANIVSGTACDEERRTGRSGLAGPEGAGRQSCAGRTASWVTRGAARTVTSVATMSASGPTALAFNRLPKKATKWKEPHILALPIRIRAGSAKGRASLTRGSNRHPDTHRAPQKSIARKYVKV